MIANIVQAWVIYFITLNTDLTYKFIVNQFLRRNKTIVLS